MKIRTNNFKCEKSEKLMEYNIFKDIYNRSYVILSNQDDENNLVRINKIKFCLTKYDRSYASRGIKFIY